MAFCNMIDTYCRSSRGIHVDMVMRPCQRDQVNLVGHGNLVDPRDLPHPRPDEMRIRGMTGHLLFLLYLRVDPKENSEWYENGDRSRSYSCALFTSITLK